MSVVTHRFGSSECVTIRRDNQPLQLNMSENLSRSPARSRSPHTRRISALNRHASLLFLILCSACTASSDKLHNKLSDSSAVATPANTTATAFKPLAVGDAAPLYNAVTFAGDSVHVGRANAPVTVMNIWATWCTSCREEMSDLEALHQEFAPKGVRVLAVSVDATEPGRVRAFVKQEKLTFSVAHDPDGNVQQLYQVVGIPATYIVGKDGRLLWKSVGNMHGVVDSLRAILQKAELQ
jgi:peroxiredoxin